MIQLDTVAVRDADTAGEIEILSEGVWIRLPARVMVSREQTAGWQDEFSRECGYSSDHLRKLFLKEYGITPLAYRNRQRMASAVSLLSNSKLSVKEIAATIGFRHVSHFCTMFRQAFSMTPREAIKKYRRHPAE